MSSAANAPAGPSPPVPQRTPAAFRLVLRLLNGELLELGSFEEPGVGGCVRLARGAAADRGRGSRLARLRRALRPPGRGRLARSHLVLTPQPHARLAAGATLSALSIWLSVLAYGSFSASSDARIAFLAATGIAAAMAAAVATFRGMSRAHTRGLTAVGAVVALMTAATIVSEVVIAAAYLVLSR